MTQVLQKPRLQANNVDLDEILQSVIALPPAGTEDVSAEMTALTEAIDAHVLMVNRKVAENNGEGNYVWKKYALRTKNSIAISNLDSTLYGFTITTIDTVTADMIADGTVTIKSGIYANSPDGSYHYILASDGYVYEQYYENGTVAQGAWSVSGNTITAGQIPDVGSSIAVKGSGIDSFSSTIDFLTPSKFFDSYVVSFDENTYPDGDTQDGYWYERVVEGVTGIDYGEVTVSNLTTNLVVQHNLGVNPRVVALLPCSNNSKSFIYVRTKTYMYTSKYYGGFVGGYGAPEFNLESGSVYTSMSENDITFKPQSSSVYLHGTYFWVAIA